MPWEKGRLAKTTLALFEKIGITCEEMKDPSSRKLIFVNEELKLKFFLAKRAGCPHLCGIWRCGHRSGGPGYHYGGAEKLFEVLDLGFGKCRMCVCGPESAKELFTASGADPGGHKVSQYRKRLFLQ